MLLSDMDHLPKQAGRARLRFCRHTQEAFRQEEHITLPAEPHDEIEWFWLRGGEQFVVRLVGQTGLGHKMFQVFFGGTDERPFLVELNAVAWRALMRSEADFFEELKPPAIRALEAQFGQQHTRRQGDIFAYPADDHWQLARTWFDGGDEVSLRQVVGWHLFETRHLLTGLVLRRNPSGNHFESHRAGDTVARGTIVAPDHDPLVLPDQHYLAQTAHLSHPPHAD